MIEPAFRSNQESPPPVPAAMVRATPRWRWVIHFVVIGAYPMIGLLFRVSTGRSSEGPALSGDVRGLLLVSAVELGFFLLFFAAAWLVSRASREQLMLPWRPGWWVVPLGIGYSIALRIGLVIIALAVVVVLAATHAITPEKIQGYVNANRPDVESMVSVSALRNNSVYFWLTITLVSFVVAGLREEMWRASTLAAMRFAWPRVFWSRSGQCLAVSVIAIAFGAMHLRMGVLAAIGAGVLGLMLGLIIIVHKSIWPAVIAHGMFDATTMGLLPWWVEKVRQLH